MQAAVRPSLDAVMAPGSIAIIGASDDPTRVGGRPLRVMLDRGYTGALYPVNPTRDTVQGLKAWRTITDIPGPVDCAIVGVRDDLVVGTLHECVAKGVRGAVIFSAGFAELGGAGVARQAELGRVAREGGLRLVGPNCTGLFNAVTNAYLTFTAPLEAGIPVGGNLGIVSQSGAVAAHILQMAANRGIRVRNYLCTGNECDVEAGDGIRWMAEQPGLEVLFLYLEGVRDGPRFLDALAAAQANGKICVAIKVGRSALGAQAAASHTASLAGADEVYGAVFRRYGVRRAESIEEALDLVHACRARVLPRDRTLCVVTTSGGVGIQVADASETMGFTMPELDPTAQAAMKKVMPLSSPRNPIDMSGQVANEISLLESSLGFAMDSRQYAAVLLFMSVVAGQPYFVAPIRAAVEKLCRRHPDTLLFMAILAASDAVAGYEAAGAVVYEEPMRALKALEGLCAIAEARRRAPAAVDAGLPASAIESIDRLREAPRRLHEDGVKRLIGELGIARPRERLVRSAGDALAAARDIGYPVCLKVVSADIAHKTEVGGVALGIGSPEALERALADAGRAVNARAPQAAIAGWLVGEMVAGGVECIVGARRDPAFGPVVMFGLGGIFVEVFRDAAVRLAPVDRAEAHAMIEDTRGAALLRGARGAPAADVDALANAIVRVSQLAVELGPALGSFEINPLRVMPQGAGVVALDAALEWTGCA